MDLRTLRDNEGSRATAADRIALFLAEMQTGRMLAGGVTQDLKAALQVLVPALVDEVGPINVEAELRAIVALTHHHWKHRLSIRLDLPEQTPEFWSRWWIARLAAMRMLMLAADSQRPINGADPDDLPKVLMAGRLSGARFELRMSLDEESPLTVDPTPDSVLLLCAKCLDGEIVTTTPPAGGASISFYFPVRLSSVSSSQ